MKKARKTKAIANELKPEHKVRRLAWRHEMKELLNSNPKYSEKVLFTDEAIFYFWPFPKESRHDAEYQILLTYTQNKV